MTLGFHVAPPENWQISPEKWWLEDENSFEHGPFSDDMLIFQGVSILTRIHPWSPQEADVDGEAPEAPPPAEAPDAKRLAAAAAAARRRGNPTKVGWLGRVRMIIVTISFVYLLYYHGNLI